MTFPAIEAAATCLSAHQSALVHQFRRLERDIGAKPYHPSTAVAYVGLPISATSSLKIARRLLAQNYEKIPSPATGR